MLYKSGSGFDEDATIADLIDKYGVEQEVAAPSSSPSKGKRKADGDVKTEKDEKEAASPSSAAKKLKEDRSGRGRGKPACRRGDQGNGGHLFQGEGYEKRR